MDTEFVDSVGSSAKADNQDVVVDFYPGSEEYIRRKDFIRSTLPPEYLTVFHIELNKNEVRGSESHKKYAVVRGTDNLDGLDNWVDEEETLILENDPLLYDNFIIKDCKISLWKI